MQEKLTLFYFLNQKEYDFTHSIPFDLQTNEEFLLQDPSK